MASKRWLSRKLLRGFMWFLCAVGAVTVVGLISGLILLRPVSVFGDLDNELSTARAVKPRLESLVELDTPEELYLDLLKRVLTRFNFGESYLRLQKPDGLVGWAYSLMQREFSARGLELLRVARFSPVAREFGLDWPLEAETMVGLKRLDNLEFCVREVVRNEVPGDLIECGAWRGGCCIYMRAVLKIVGDRSRRVWVADSFEGLPKVDPVMYPEDAAIWQGGEMAVSIEEVRANFAKFGMLDDRVKFLKGFFVDTLPTAPIEKLAILRLDADLYESTTQGLEYLYPKLSIGGYVIIDDYNLAGARKATLDYLETHGIKAKFIRIDHNGIYWQKEK